MLDGNTYRIDGPTMALFLDGDLHVTRTVPAGSIVSVHSESLNGKELVNVTWVGKQVMMFAQDIKSRGTKINETSR